MIESEWDCMLESERGLTLASGHTTEVTARVYQKNRPAYNCPVRLLVQPSGEKFSMEELVDALPSWLSGKRTKDN